MPQLKQLKLVTLFGILLLIIGISMFSYSIKVIEEQEKTLNTTEVTLDQLWNYESSADWWKNVFVTLILPLTSVFISIGGATLTSKAILPVIQNKKSNMTKRKQENP